MPSKGFEFNKTVSPEYECHYYRRRLYSSLAEITLNTLLKRFYFESQLIIVNS